MEEIYELTTVINIQARSDTMTEKILIETYMSMWNNFGISELESILDNDIEYESQFVFESLFGKTKIVSYLTLKIEAIKMESIPVLAEYATYNGNPCMVLTQFFIDDGMSGDDPNLIKEDTTEFGFKYNYRESVILFKFKNKKINRINLCVIPAPSETKKVDNIDLRNEKISQLENSL